MKDAAVQTHNVSPSLAVDRWKIRFKELFPSQMKTTECLSSAWLSPVTRDPNPGSSTHCVLDPGPGPARDPSSGPGRVTDDNQANLGRKISLGIAVEVGGPNTLRNYQFTPGTPRPPEFPRPLSFNDTKIPKDGNR